MAGKIVADFQFGTGQEITGLINDLTTGGTDKALTAEQGKILNNRAFGVGQTYQLVTASRANGTTYTNSTGKTIFVIVRGYTLELYIRGYVNNELLSNFASTTTRTEATIVLPVPNGSTYKIDGFAVDAWWELR